MNSRASRLRKGLAAIEAALLLPLVCLLLFGLIEYGWIFLKAQQLNAAARHAARLAIIDTATNAQVTSECDSVLNACGFGSSGYTITLSPADITSLAPGETLTITVTVPYANIELIGIPMLPVPVNLSGSTSMAKEGPQ